MPYDDCSRTETCPSCPEEELDEPEKPESEKCAYGEHDFRAFQGFNDEPGKPHCLTCGHAWGECTRHLAEKPEPSTECEGGCRVYTAPPCRDPAKCSCGGEWWKHGCKHSLPPARHCEGCGYPHIPGNHTCGHATDEAGCCACQAETEPRCTCGPDEACSECPEPEEPPLTPEEEEELSLTENDIDRMAAEGEPVELIPPPPQPDRRPPYLVAYSVQGHLYEMALPGDATVAALDGRLVITHQLGPVAGICQIAPITSEES